MREGFIKGGAVFEINQGGGDNQRGVHQGRGSVRGKSKGRG